MTTANDFSQLDAFIDGELDLKSQLEIERRMESDAALRRQVEDLRQLRSAVRGHASYHAAPDTLRARLAQLASVDAGAAGPAEARTARPAARRHAPGRAAAEAVWRWLAWRPLVASFGFAAVLAVALNMALMQSVKDDRLVDDVVASHVRATLGQHLVDVASSDHHTVKPFLSARLGFSPPVNELQLPGCVFLGGRVDYLDGRPVAALVYKFGEHIVNAFIWPASGRDREPAFQMERGFRIARWSQGDMEHWVISDVNGEEFKRLVRSMVSAGTPR